MLQCTEGKGEHNWRREGINIHKGYGAARAGCVESKEEAKQLVTAVDPHELYDNLAFSVEVALRQ